MPQKKIDQATAERMLKLATHDDISPRDLAKRFGISLSLTYEILTQKRSDERRLLEPKVTPN
jgi:transposase